MTRNTLKNRVQEIIHTICNQREWNMRNGYGEMRSDMLESISVLKNEASYIVDKDDQAHIDLVNRLRDDIKKIMPGAYSKKVKLRERVQTMIDYCARQSNVIHKH